MLDETYYCQLKTMSYLHFKEKTKQIKQKPPTYIFFPTFRFKSTICSIYFSLKNNVAQ